MLSLLEDGRFAVDLRNWVDQLVRIELIAAVVALVAARALRMADRALAFDVAVWQRTAGGRRDRDLLRALVNVAVGQTLAEHLLHHVLMVLCGGAGEQIVAQAEVAQIVRDHAVVAVRKFLRGDALLVGLHQNRRTMLVGAGHHEHIVALHALVSCVDVGRHTEAGDVTNMTGAVRIRPSDVHHNMTHTPDYLHALGHFRTVFRPVAASPCADWRSLDYSQSTSHAFTLSTYPHFPRNSWSPPHVLPSMCGMRIRAHTQRPTGKGERRERNIRP